MRPIIPSSEAVRSGRPATLKSLVERLVDGLQREAADCDRPLPRLVVDVAADHRLPADAAALRSLVESGLRAAVQAAAASATMARTGEVVITSVEYPGRLELEIADTGPGREERQTPAGRFADAMQAAAEHRLLDRLAASVRFDDCPEGGMALTYSMPLAAAHRAAA